MNRAAGRGRILRPAARSLRANASVTGPGRSHGRCQGPPPSWACGRTGSPGERSRRRTVAGCSLCGNPQGVRRIPAIFVADIYIDHRMISTCIRFDSNRAVPYSPSRYPHGTATKSLPPGSATSRSIALNSPFADRSGLPLSCRPHDRSCSRRSPQRSPRTREIPSCRTDARPARNGSAIPGRFVIPPSAAWPVGRAMK
jgi:hypothetical protein